jgi:methylthioribose-1-phosphate isomerase
MKVKINGRSKDIQTVSYNEKLNQVCLIDQRLLPHKFAIVNTKNYIETAEAIKNMTVRGAPAIAATAAYGLAQGLWDFKGSDISKFRRHIDKVFQTSKAPDQLLLTG